MRSAVTGEWSARLSSDKERLTESSQWELDPGINQKEPAVGFLFLGTRAAEADTSKNQL